MKTPTIDWAKAPNIALLKGGEEYLKDHLVQQAQSTLSDHQTSLLWGGIDTDTQIRNHLFEGSLIPVQKLIVLRDANKVDKGLLKQYCDNPSSDNVLVLVASSGRLPAWFTSLKSDAQATCSSPKPWEYKDWLVSYCRSRGFSLDANYAESVHANVGDDLYALSNEMEKVFLGMRQRRTIGPQDITSVLVQHQPINPFNVVKAWGMRDIKGSLRMASIYFHQTQDPYSSLPLLSMLLGQIEKLILFDSYQKSEYQKKELCEAMGISNFVYEELHRNSIHWRRQELRKVYQLTCEIEAKAKSGGNGPLLIYWLLSQENLNP